MPQSATHALSPPSEFSSSRLRLPDGATTTLHVARFDRAAVRPKVMLVGGQRPLAVWCRAEGVEDAIVGGFFTRPAGVALGELRVDGAAHPSVPFDPPWQGIRSCLHVNGAGLRLAPRWAFGPEPPGDLLQAGPLLVRDGRTTIVPGVDPEGFSAGARQFDSDITRGRYPRAALAVADGMLLAVACDGRARRDSGLTLTELADALVALGAEEAINLDGGGSASLVHGGRLRNRPREEHGLPLPVGRPIATAIAFLPA